MGRSDAVKFTLEWAAEARRLGATVTFEPGWESRGNGQSADYEGGIVHHTGFISSAENPNPALRTLIHGRPDLSGPLCNVTGPYSTPSKPLLHVIAAYPANHAGASGGRSMGPLPVTGLFNKRVFGLEIDYAGTHPMSDGQYRAAQIFTRALTNVLKRSVEYVRGHAETSITGKWDPGYAPSKTIDMNAFRKNAATVTAGDVPPEEEFMFRVLRSDPAQSAGSEKGSGEMIMVAPGAMIPISSPAYYNAYKAHGFVSSEVLNLAPNWFRHYKSLFSGQAPSATDIAEAVLRSSVDSKAGDVRAAMRDARATTAHIEDLVTQLVSRSTGSVDVQPIEVSTPENADPAALARAIADELGKRLLEP